MILSVDIFACRTCGFEFEYERIKRPRTVCDDCQEVKRKVLQRRSNAKWSAKVARLQGEATVVLPDGHPVLPLLARHVDLLCAARLALAALRTGRYDVAVQALTPHI